MHIEKAWRPALAAVRHTDPSAAARRVTVLGGGELGAGLGYGPARFLDAASTAAVVAELADLPASEMAARPTQTACGTTRPQGTASSAGLTESRVASGFVAREAGGVQAGQDDLEVTAEGGLGEYVRQRRRELSVPARAWSGRLV